MGLVQALRNFRRIQQIAGILLKYGFEDVVSNTPLKSVVPTRRRLAALRGEADLISKYSRPQLARMAAEELGPTFIKLAQILSNRPDMVPGGYVAEFEKLQSQVSPFSSQEAKQIISKELKRDISDIFANFVDKPIGSASIGQVHRATLHNGLEVVVKVRRPGVVQKVITDLSIIKDVVKRGEAFFKSQGIYNSEEIVETFERSIIKELDYTNECRYIEQFREYYKDHTNFYVPKPLKEYTTKQVLVMEFIGGCKITDVNQLRQWNLEPSKIAETGMDIYLMQIFQHGYFHADPHPGNIIIQPDGRICLIDFGMVGKLTRSDRITFAGVLIAMAQLNAREMARQLKNLAIDADIENERQFEAAVGELIDDFGTLSLEESNMAEFATRLQDIIRQYRLQLPGGIFIILRALTILEGIGKNIHPNFQTYKFIQPYGVKILLDQYSPSYLADETRNATMDLAAFINDLPREVREIIRKLRRGKLKIENELSGYEPAIQQLTKSYRQIAQGIVIVGVLIAAVLASHINTSNLSSLSMIGFSIGGVLLVKFLWNTFFGGGK